MEQEKTSDLIYLLDLQQVQTSPSSPGM